MFEGFTVRQIYGWAWWFTLRSVTETLYLQNPVTSDVLSFNELVSIHAEAIGEFLYSGIIQEDFDSRVRKYEETINFISSVTTPMYSS